MFTHHAPRHDFADTLAIDPVAEMARADAADLGLLRLVGCCALATLLLAVAGCRGL